MTGAVPFARTRRFAGALAIAASVAIVLIWIAVQTGLAASLDRALLIDIAGWARARPVALKSFQLATIIGDPVARLVITALAGIFFWKLGYRRVAAFLVAAHLGGWMACTLIKESMARSRPTVLAQLDAVSTYSFPSSHAWNAMTLYGGLAVAAAILPGPGRRLWIVATALSMALLIGISRLALGVHWPSDIVAGWCGGVASLGICYRLILVPSGVGARRQPR